MHFIFQLLISNISNVKSVVDFRMAKIVFGWLHLLNHVKTLEEKGDIFVGFNFHSFIPILLTFQVTFQLVSN
jgi:hypothetical protein